MLPIEPGEKPEAIALALLGDEAGIGRRKQVKDWIGFADADQSPLMGGGQKAGAPVGRTIRRKAAHVRQDNERRQILVQTPKAIGKPRAHMWETGKDEPAVLHEGGRAMDV